MNQETILQRAFDALLEASSLFDNYPETLECIGTYQVVHAALNELLVELRKESE